MKGLKKIIAIIIAYMAMMTTYTCSANIIVDYTIAPQSMINNAAEPSGQVYGTFTADFTDQTLTAVDMYIDIFGDAIYHFNTPIAFGAYTNALFPSLTYYEANLTTSSLGAYTNTTFYMDFIQNDNSHLFWGNTTLGNVFTSFGAGRFMLPPGTLPAPVSEVNTIFMMLLGLLSMQVYRKPTTVLKA